MGNEITVQRYAGERFLVPASAEPDLETKNRLWFGMPWGVTATIEHFTRKLSAIDDVLGRYAAAHGEEGYALARGQPQIEISVGDRIVTFKDYLTELISRRVFHQRELATSVQEVTRAFFTKNLGLLGYFRMGRDIFPQQGDLQEEVQYALETKVWLSKRLANDYDFRHQMACAMGLLPGNNQLVKTELTKAVEQVGYPLGF